MLRVMGLREAKPQGIEFLTDILQENNILYAN